MSNATINANEVGQYNDWIEIYNNTDANINLKGYYFTNNIEQPKKFKVPSSMVLRPGVYCILWADELDNNNRPYTHLNFKLKKKGGELALFHPDGKTLVHRLTYKQQYTDFSYGKNAANEWRFFKQPTPNKENNTAGKKEALSIVKISKSSGHYQKPLLVDLNCIHKEARIHYTTDGSTPTETSTIYRNSIKINQSTAIKAIALTDDHHPSSVATFFYHIDTNASILPIVHISLPPDEFEEIYGKTSAGCKFNCDRQAFLSYISTDGSLAFESKVGIQISGKSSRLNDQQSFEINFRDRYDSKRINYDLFQTDSNYQIHTILLRNGGNAWNKSMINDVLAQSFANELNVDHQNWQPAVAYVNGEYWGIYHVLEKVNRQYLDYHHACGTDDIDMVNEEFIAIKGDNQSYNALFNFAKENDLSQVENYQKVISQIDLESYIDYYILETYFANVDWPRRNIKAWKSTETGKWRWIFYDLDFSFGLTNQNFIKRAMGETRVQSPDFLNNGILFKALMDNPDFKKTFITQLNYHMDSTFSPQKIIARIDSIEALLKPEMPHQLDRWKHQCEKLDCTYNAEYEAENGLEVWLEHLENLRMFANKRREKVIEDILEVE